jgi:8-oxo-dGTP diphosphatase
MSPSTPVYRDSHGKTLNDYPRPSVAVDTAVLTVADGCLQVLLTLTNDAAQRRTTDQWRLPGTFLHRNERLSDAVRRSLNDKAGVLGLTPRQLHVFDEPYRDDRGWVLSVAHLAAVRSDSIPSIGRTKLVPVDALGPLEYGHDEIITAAVAQLHADYRHNPDPATLLPDTAPDEPPDAFTIRELRMLHETVLGRTFNADTFRRTMLPSLAPTGHWRQGARGKPAELYRRA